MEQSVLLSNRSLIVTLSVDDDDQARLEIQSTVHGPLLTNADDVVVILNGQGVALTFIDERHVHAEIGDWAPYATYGGSLMLRVDEFVDGWEFEAEP